MKLTREDNLQLRRALAACKVAGIELAVISEGKIRGMSESRNAVIFSDFQLSIDPEIQLGITRLGELEKRLTLFGDEVQIELEVTDAKKVRKLSVRGQSGKIEFRCTDVAMLDKKYPKIMSDSEVSVITLAKHEASLISRGTKTLGAEAVTIQVKRDGAVHIESVDSVNDKFETDLAASAEFIDVAVPSVFNYSTAASGVFLQLIDHATREHESTQLIMMKSGNVSITVLGCTIIAIPRIITGV